MCGIAGIFGYAEAAPPVDQEELLRIREAMIKRGPDGAGLWLSPDRQVGLAHRRLAIIDLSKSGAQPMATADGRYRITFNGEIYNYRALRRELEAKGCVFRSNSDTEVLLHLYAERGQEMVHALRGMFAFGIWDEGRKALFLARDPFGIKPLYYADDGKTFRFASQVKALKAGNALDLTPDPAGSAGFLIWGFVPEPFTLYKAVSALPAGCSLSVDRQGARQLRRFFDIADEYRQAEARAATLNRNAALEHLEQVLQGSVDAHMVADVAVGVFLSAGIDSSLIAKLASKKAGSDLRCVTLGFEEYRGGANDETVLAGQTASWLDASHDVDWIGKQDFYDEVPDIISAMDQPSIDGINTYFVARAAARQGLKVALSGIGGDELFAGYPSFQDVPRIVRTFRHAALMPGWIRRGTRRLGAPLLRPFTSPKYAGLLEYGDSQEGAYLLRRGVFMPWELPRVLGAEIAQEGWDRLQTIDTLCSLHEGVRTDSSLVSCLELGWYMRGQLLRDADWAGMAHSVEIRVPLVDPEVLRAAATLLAAGAIRSKQEIADLPALALPSALRDRPKSGFLVPVHEWLDEIGPSRRPERRLRGWAKSVYRQFTGQRAILSLVTEAFGGTGGIALYGRDFLSALCSDPATRRVVAIPRHATNPLEALPTKLDFDTSGRNGKLRYAAAVLRILFSGERFDMVICGHIHMLPLAVPIAAFFNAPLVLVIYGVEAWKPTPNRLANWLARRSDAVVSISNLTLERFRTWSEVAAQKCAILPNAIHLDRYGERPKNQELVERYGLQNRKIVMVLGRLATTERYKGVDEVLEVMPRLLERIRNLAYLVVGDGSDRLRLEAKCAALGLSRSVVFAGRVAEAEKADHFRLADAFVMPSTGEGFGFVFLEALACGVPTVGSKTDGGREALRDGALGRLVDPANATEIEEAILQAVWEPKRVLEGLAHFSYSKFEQRWHRLLVSTSVLCR